MTKTERRMVKQFEPSKEIVGMAKCWLRRPLYPRESYNPAAVERMARDYLKACAALAKERKHD